MMTSIRRNIRYYGATTALRLQLVSIIERIAPYRYCHAWLIVWALGHCTWSEVREEHGHTCRKDSDNNSGCYCGYYWNGKLNRK
jgi:hypothetical protein